jgi:hypothetical protein
VTGPSLSIVVTGRNDQYGGDFNERFFTSLRFNRDQLAERAVAVEVILVEWNPIPGKPYLSELLSKEFPSQAGSLMRRYVVAPQYHAALTQNPLLPYLEYMAKNVGIRRASAPFVLVTNTDVLLGRRVVNAIAGDLPLATILRAARYDIKLGIDQSHLTVAALEDPANQVRQPVLKPPLFNGGSGDFVLADRDTWHRLRGYNEVYRAARVAIDLNFLVKAHGAGYPIADIGGPVYHINHVGSLRMSKALYRDTPTDTPWGNLRWHSRHVVYQNRDEWGLAEAPETTMPDGSVFLEFDWNALPPLIELRRIVLPARQTIEESVPSS